MIKKFLIFVLLVLVLALGIKKLKFEKESVANQSTPPMPTYAIQTTKAQHSLLQQKHQFLAQLKSDKEVKVATKLSGNIKKLFVSESQSVKKGEKLVMIDDRVLKTNLQTLLKNLAVQKHDVAYYESIEARNKKLYEADAISKEKYDASKLMTLNKKSQLDATKEKIKAVKSDLTYLQIKAPFSGIVATLFLHEGDLALTGKPILLLNTFAQKMEFSYANSVKGIKVGAEVYSSGKLIGNISKIYPNTKNNLNTAEIKLSADVEVKNNGFVSVDVVTSQAEGCSVPLDALLHTKDATYIVTYENHKFTKKVVDVVLESDSKALINPCTDKKIAVASESKLAVLPFYANINIVGDDER